MLRRFRVRRWVAPGVKLGQNDISPVQTALVTGQSGTEVVTSLEVRATDSIGTPRSERARPKVSSSDAE